MRRVLTHFGALFWVSLALTLPAARERVWAAARPGLPAVTTYTTLAMVTTLLHLDRFHLHGPSLGAEVAGWAWIAVYALVPPVLIIFGLALSTATPPRGRG